MNGRRLLHIGRVLATHAVAHVLAERAARWPGLFRRSSLAQLPGPKRLRRLFEDLGGSFIKFGQLLALQPDVLPPEYCSELSNLLDHIAPFSYEEVERVFHEELGRTPEEAFASFDRTPLSTASIGQVHVAYLGSEKVAVKVQRPVVDVEFAADIRLILLATGLIRRFRVSSMLWALEPMDEFAEWTREELDFRREGRYADRLRRNAAENPVEHVPEVFWEFTTRRTLVTEFMRGETALTHIRAMEQANREPGPRTMRALDFDRDRFARHIIHNFIGDVFRHGVFHADLHPANLFVLPGEVVGYVDFGITGVLSGYTRRHLVAMTLACTRADIDGLVDAFLLLARTDEGGDRARFRSGLAEMAQGWYRREGSRMVLTRNFTAVMLDMLTLCRRTGILPERDVIKYIRSTVAADGLIKRLAPGFNVGAAVEVACRELVLEDLQKTLLSRDPLVAVLESGSHLFGSGLTRFATILRRLAQGELIAEPEISESRDPDARLRQQALTLAGIVAALTSLVWLTGGAGRFGLNIVTAELTLAAVAVLALLNSIRKLARA